MTMYTNLKCLMCIVPISLRAYTISCVHQILMKCASSKQAGRSLIHYIHCYLRQIL